MVPSRDSDLLLLLSRVVVELGLEAALVVELQVLLVGGEYFGEVEF